MSTTAIEWTDSTWNPTTGCDRVSRGCDNCYALTQAARLKRMGQARYQTDGDPRTSGPGFGVAMHEDALPVPLGWRRPRRVFVNSMSDLFHPKVTDEFIARVFAVMACAPRHTFQVLTKRAPRMASLLSSEEFRRRVQRRAPYEQDNPYVRISREWPLPNVWLGTSVEDGEQAAARIPRLRETPAAVRFLSCEPLLGPLGRLDLDGIGWVIVGGESGRRARPMHPDWARSIRDQCTAAGVPFFFKQWGQYAVVDDAGPDGWRQRRETDVYVRHDGWRWPLSEPHGAEDGTEVLMRRVPGKHDAGRALDGRTWDEFPTATPVPTP